MAWWEVYHPAQGTPPKDGWFRLPVAKDALKACASLKKFGLYLSFLCWLMSVIAHGLGPALSLAEGHVQGRFVQGIAAHFIAWKSMWDQVGLGQTGVVWLLNRVNCCGTDSLLGSFNVSQTVRLKNTQNMKLFYYYFLRHFENTCEWSLLKGSPQNCFTLSTHKSQTCDF